MDILILTLLILAWLFAEMGAMNAHIKEDKENHKEENKND